MGAKTWAAIRAFFQVDWAFMKDAWGHEGLFWFREFLLVAAMLYMASHLIKRRPFLSRAYCWLLGHSWVMRDRNHARWQAYRAIRGDLAGSLCECRICKEVSNDLPRRRVEEAQEQTETTEATEAVEDEFDRAVNEMQQEAHRIIDSVMPPTRTPANPGVTVTTTRVTRTTTARSTTAAPKKKAAAAAPKKRGGKRPTRFDRDVLGDEEPKASASPPAAAEPQKPADTSSPSGPSGPEGSEPS